MSETSSAKVYLPSGKVAARYNRSGRTIDRWTSDPKLGFPKPIVIRGKRFWDEALLEQFERDCALAKVEEASASRSRLISERFVARKVSQHQEISPEHWFGFGSVTPKAPPASTCRSRRAATTDNPSVLENDINQSGEEK